MPVNQAVITDFHIRKPRYLSTQQYAYDWLLTAHAKAEETKNKAMSPDQIQNFKNELQKILLYVGCKTKSVQTRGHELSDFLHEKWDDMLVYRLNDFSQGISITERQKIHQEVVSKIFDYFYENVDEPPHDMIHVSCTGYASPSSPQKIIVDKKWMGKTNVLHLYHMGCYAALPAIRVAASFAQQPIKRVDIVHTEFCTLHFNPGMHNPESLVAQTLFADGFVKYSVISEENAQLQKNPYLKILALHEQLIPDSSEAMQWLLSDWGFQFILSKEIPAIFTSHVKSFVEFLCQKAGLNADDLYQNATFAIHPGGPRILQDTQRIFKLRDDQMAASYLILKTCGNMSSATLPHIWKAICENPEIPDNTNIVTIAFGPGLTLIGGILRKGSG